MKPIGSATTTLRKEAECKTGTQRGEHGSATPASSQQIAEWLGRQRPADMDAVAVSRAQQHGVGLNVRYEHRFPTGENGEYLPSYRVAVMCEVDGDEDDIASALSDLRNFMQPADIRTIEAWLAELSVVVARRQDDEFSEDLRLAAYSGRLGRFPADVVKEVLLRQTYKFWPTWDELEKRCRALTGPRSQMIAALERGATPREPERRPATQDERDRIQALVDEMFPMRSKEMRDRAVEEITKGKCMKKDKPHD